jgi:hypothetical protein
MAYGWALVTDVDGVPVLDLQGDIVEVEDLRGSVHDFIRSDRIAGIIHGRDADGNPIQVGEIVESMVISPDIEAALGVEFGKSGWFIGMHVTADSVWADVKSGKLPAFSIGGTGQRVALSA